MNKRLIIIIISCLFVGFIGGMMTTRMITHKRLKEMVEMQRPPRFYRELRHELKLNQTEEARFDSIFHEHIGSMKQLRRKERTFMKEELEGLFNRLTEGLNPEQVELIRKTENKLKQGHKKRMKRDRKRHDGRHKMEESKRKQ